MAPRAARRRYTQLLATAAYMIGRQDEYFSALGRAHQAHLNAGAALLIADAVDRIETGLTLAAEAIDSGRAATVLQKLVAVSNAGAEAAAS